MGYLLVISQRLNRGGADFICPHPQFVSIQSQILWDFVIDFLHEETGDFSLRIGKTVLNSYMKTFLFQPPHQTPRNKNTQNPLRKK